ncbi:hypothetical protein HY635_04165 [Candidatus Uhrbacteria bacterium]|nr:hypothetical protein [Candidatus Uhrbacteria bacterium]
MTTEQVAAVRELIAWSDGRRRSDGPCTPNASVRKFLTSRERFPLTSEQASEILRAYAGIPADVDYL